MRSALIGVYFAGKTETIRDYVRASTRLTHTDPKAEAAALAVALTASWAAITGESAASRPDTLREIWVAAYPDNPEWSALVDRILSAHQRQRTVAEFVQELGLTKGVTGYAYHTLPVALFAWLKHFGDYRTGLEAVLSSGGDTDTVGAITGALLAINSPIPEEWSARICDYPISLSYLEQLATTLESESAIRPTFLWMALPFRNLIFLVVVLAHVVRRLIPL